MTKLGLGLVAITLLSAQSAQDPEHVLEQARDKLIPRLPRPGYTGVATINRSFFSPRHPPLFSRSCEQISMDRKKGRTKLQLDKTNRVRVNVVLTRPDEIYSWTGPGGFSRKVDEILQAGPIGTGEFGAYLLEIFSNPPVQFRVLRQTENQLEYGFRVPVEASNNLFWDGGQWRAAGYDGSFVVDPSWIELKQLTLETGELPRDTSMCEATATLDFPSGTTGVLLPSRAESHFVMRDSSETERITTFSDCRESPQTAPERPPERLIKIPEGRSFKLAFTTPIDTATAAAGDIVRAKLAEPALGIPPEATFTGRIMGMQYIIRRTELLSHFFLIWIVFDRIEVKGVVSSFQARLLAPMKIDGNESERAFTFERTANFIIPAGFKSAWVTFK